MNSSSGITKSVWQVTAPEIGAPDAAQNGAHFDVCIVGAGISGLSAAYNLARAGKSVLVVDDGAIGGGETAHTTAHLSNVIDDGYAYIEKNHGESGAKLARESHGAAIDFIENTARQENIDCEFARLDGYLFLEEGENTDELDEESAAMLRAGLQHEKLNRLELPNFSAHGAALKIPQQAQFHPLKYLAGLARSIESKGGKLVASTRVTQIDDSKDGEAARVHFETGSITANAIIVATNSPFNDRVAMHTKQSPYRTFVIGARVEENSVPHALLWDNLDPYHYVRLTHDENGAVLIIGGEDHKTGQKDDGIDRFARLEAWGKQYFPALGETVFRWSGQVMEPSDGLAFIGKNPGDECVYIVTGDSGMGMTHGTLAGILLCDLICGKENVWSELYDPARKMTHSIADFAKENLNVAAQYADWAKSGDVNSTDEIAAGEGAILRRGLTKVAAYRDESGALHERSAVCPHLGCVVAWNSLEKSWDCPCHGSRFDATGCVLNGPANRDLGEIESDDVS